MFLVQILLPARDNQGEVFSDDLFREVREMLVQRFGGVTAYLQSPAQGVWRNEEKETSRDEIFLVEVMTNAIEHVWWANYRQELEAIFRQQQLVIRAHEVRLL